MVDAVEVVEDALMEEMEEMDRNGDPSDAAATGDATLAAGDSVRAVHDPVEVTDEVAGVANEVASAANEVAGADGAPAVGNEASMGGTGPGDRRMEL